jgi:hypothetical protein
MDGNVTEHQTWLAMADVRGRVVTVGALEAAGAHLTHPVDQARASLRTLAASGRVVDLPAFLRDVLDWPEDLLVPRAALPAGLRVPGERGEVLAPAYALRSADEPDGFVLLVQEVDPGAGLSDPRAEAGLRFEQLLRATGVALGLLTDGFLFRLVYAPALERAGAITFRLPELLDEAEGRPLLGAFHMLLNGPRLLSLPPERRLLGLVRASRAYRIERLQIERFGSFERAELRFAAGINVFIGANGTGKTHAMKALYAALKPFEQAGEPLPIEARLAAKFANVFKPDEGQLVHLIRRPSPVDARIVVEGAGKVDLSLQAEGQPVLTLAEGSWQGASSILYVPTREVLAMYEGFIAAYQKRDLSFDETYHDLCVALGATPLRGGEAEEAVALAASLDAALGGKPVLRGGRFYRKDGDDLLEAHLLAEGLRKVATLSHLLGNGSLTADGLLFWDEPEANMNPRLITLIADLLVDLAGLGAQVFVTTHDYLLSHRLSLISEYGRRPDVPIRFFAFHRPVPGGPVRVDAGATLAELPDNPILDEFTRHYDFERDLFDGPVATTVKA